MYKTRKVILLMIITLAVSFGALKVINIGSEFTAEKLLYKTLDVYKNIPFGADEQFLGMQMQVEGNLKSIISRFPGGDATKAAHLNLAGLYLEVEKYNEAISVADEILSKYKNDTHAASRAQFIKGVSYERKGKWSRALDEFKILQKNYPKTKLSLEIPLYILRHYKRGGETDQLNKRTQRVIIYYDRIISKYKGSPLGYYAGNMLVQTFMVLDRYEEAGSVLKNMIVVYPEMLAVRQLPYVELIFVKTLKKPEEAIEIYRYIMVKTKDHKLKKFLEAKIDELEM